MKIEVEKKVERFLSDQKSEEISPSVSEWIKKPISIRRKVTRAPENTSEGKKFLDKKISINRTFQDPNLKEIEVNTQKTLSKKNYKQRMNNWSNLKDEYIQVGSPKNKKFLKQRRSASQKNISAESFGEQGNIMLKALKTPERKKSLYEFTHGFHSYPGRMHPDLPKTLLEQFPTGIKVFDPFMGGGTVLLEGMLLKHKVMGNDLSPIANLVVKERCRWISEKNASHLWEVFEQVKERVKIRSVEKRNVQRANLNWLNKHHPAYLFVELLQWIDAIENIRNANERDTLRAVFSSLIVKFSNKISETSQFSKPPTFPKGAVGVWMEKKTHELLKNQIELAKRISKSPSINIWNEDISSLEGPEKNSIDCTIMSPPFPGTYDYLEMQVLRMKWLGYSTEKMVSGEISDRNYTPKQWKQIFREFMLKVRRWTSQEGVCYLHLGDWLEGGERLSGLDFVRKYSDSVGWNVEGSASVRREIFDINLRRNYGELGKWEHLILLRH